MSGRAFFDTNILVYVIGEKEQRTERAEELIAGGGVISVQVLNELAAVAHRKLGMSWASIGDALEAIRVLCPTTVPLTTDTHDTALRLASQYKFAFYDALIVAAALEADCSTLYSEDFQDGQVIARRLAVRNPFIAR